jgi:hypothetical protein
MYQEEVLPNRKRSRSPSPDRHYFPTELFDGEAAVVAPEGLLHDEVLSLLPPSPKTARRVRAGGEEEEEEDEEEEDGERGGHHGESTQPSQSNELWGLPGIVGEIYGNRGITQFYDWQLECLNNKAFLEGKNLVYSLPTSGGKVRCLDLLPS